MNLERLDAYRWRLPRQGKMRVDGLIYASDRLMKVLRDEQALTQVANVAHLPGILRYSYGMPDIHWGYGFPIGGVAATDPDEGVISPGGVGYDINCGVRLLRSGLDRQEVEPELDRLVDALYRSIPTGVGSHRRDLRISRKEMDRVLRQGASWAVTQGFGENADLEVIEEGGRLPWADPVEVSERAKQRGSDQVGTLGSGNHFVEVQYVDEVYDARAAAALGLRQDQVTLTIHTGSRGLGYQVCDDFLRIMQNTSSRYGIELPDRQLCCAPLRSDEGRRYMAAMAAAANFAFCNRQVITHWARQCFEEVFGGNPQAGLDTVYDVCHNIAKFETHLIDGQEVKVCVHRKGATRAFPPGHPEVPAPYREVGQPVLIPGDMGRYSFVLVGTEKARLETFGSTCHGAGRLMSRTKARQKARGRSIIRELRDAGVVVKATGRATLVEEMPEAYKDVSEVVDTVHEAGISRKVARVRPIGVIKG
ncbi:MAG: RtcB family protein [Acidobacteria bacterium]|nr:RtcB family protein [Acidobacteriota bacterium]